MGFSSQIFGNCKADWHRIKMTTSQIRYWAHYVTMNVDIKHDLTWNLFVFYLYSHILKYLYFRNGWIDWYDTKGVLIPWYMELTLIFKVKFATEQCLMIHLSFCYIRYILRIKYVMWRNRVVKLHQNSIRNDFTHRCHGNVGSKNFYKTIKPFLSTKQSHYSGSKIILKENDSIISDASKVADIFNMYYASIAEYKHQSDGLDNLDFDNAIDKHASHTSISLIKQSISGNYEFSFSPISAQSMSKYISYKSNKAVGHDGSWNVLVIICPPLFVMYSMRVSLPVTFLVLLNGLILILYTISNSK